MIYDLNIEIKTQSSHEEERGRARIIKYRRSSTKYQSLFLIAFFQSFLVQVHGIIIKRTTMRLGYVSVKYYKERVAVFSLLVRNFFLAKSKTVISSIS